MLFTGCETTQSVKVESARTIATTQQLVIGAMNAYTDLVVQGKVDLDQREKVRTAYREFKTQERLAISLLNVSTDVDITPEGLDSAFDQLIAILNTIN